MSGALNDVTGGNTSALSKIIVAGNVNSNDFQIANNFSTCAVVDLSRTYGITTVPGSCWYGNDHLTRIMLPSCITRIGYSAFNGATALAELTCLATTPPTLDSYVFDGVNKGLIVFVPKASVEIYEQAEGWKTTSATAPSSSCPCSTTWQVLRSICPRHAPMAVTKTCPSSLSTSRRDSATATW